MSTGFEGRTLIAYLPWIAMSPVHVTLVPADDQDERLHPPGCRLVLFDRASPE